MMKDGLMLGTLKRQTFDLKFTKATILIAENKLSAL